MKSFLYILLKNRQKNNTVEVLKFGGKKMRFIEVNGTEHIFVDVGHCESLELYENDCVIKISDELIVLSEDCLNKIACKESFDSVITTNKQ